MPFLELNDIRKLFGQTVAVERFQLKAERGEFISFLGPSGCGKTTTLRMIAGFERPSEGQIVIDGTDVTQTPPNRRNIGMVFQSYALFPNMTVAENIGFGLRVARRSPDEIRNRVGEMLHLIHMEAYERRYPYQLSGGQQQRVALARALAIRPQVLLLDEPLSALDAKIRVSLRQEIRAIQKQLGITAIYVTHDQEEALSLSDRIVVMSQGHVEQIGTPFEIYNFPRTRFVASFVGTLNLLNVQVLDTSKRHVSVDGQAITLNTSLEHFQHGQTVSLALRPEIIALDGVNKDNSNRLTGTVADITFLGSTVRIGVKMSEQHFHLDCFNTPSLVPPKLGEAISVSFPPEACMLLREGDERGT